MDAHVVVRGRVQGVGFRWFVRETARAAGLSGWVKNRADGAVEVAASGEAASISQLRSALLSGPPGAAVTSVDDLEPTAEPLPSQFTIIR